MKKNFERVVQEGMSELEKVREGIAEYAKRAEEAVKGAESKMASLGGFINSLEDRAFTSYDPILAGELNFGEGDHADPGYSSIRVSNYEAPLGNFFTRGGLSVRGERLSGKYRVRVLFKKVK